MATFIDILNKFRKESFSQKDKGFRFERLMQAYLKTTALYSHLFEEVWLWSEFPHHDQFGGKDTGIDLVAKTYTGDYWAIQCKCYAADSYIDKPSVDSFLATSGRSFESNGESKTFSQRLWISTTNKWNATAEQTIKNQNPPVTRLNLIDLDNDAVDWDALEKGVFGTSARTAQFSVLDHQKTAIDKTHEYFQIEGNNRGKLIMACGTGKTFTSLKIAENETDNKGLILFLVPSIALLGQTLRVWKAQSAQPLDAVCICSDAQVAKQVAKNDDNSTFSTIDLALPATTDVHSIVRQLRYLRGKQQGMTVVFSTYQSIEVVSKAQHKLLEETDDEYGKFDLIICDEAHRTTGVTLKDENESAFVKVHDNDFLWTAKRIYMTATPRLYTDAMKDKAKQSDAVLCSMDDKSMYGDEIYRIGFGEAVDKKLLTDYKVLILAVGDKDITPALRNVLTNEDGTIETDDAAKFVGCVNALSKRVLGDEGLVKDADPLPMRRAVAFCQNIKKSKETAEIFSTCKESYMADVPDNEKSEMVNVAARHVDGTMSATMRDEALMWLKEQPENECECRMLTNARCLSEGVDVPSLDAVVFVSAKNSQVDVVQSVGRVMRRSEGKQYGYIIIPVVVPADVEGDKVLENHPNFKVVWTVLNALRAHDDRFNAEVNKIELSKKKPKNIIFGGVGGRGDDNSEGDGTPKKSAAQVMAEQLSLSFDELQNVFYAKLVTKVGTKRYWEQWARDIAQIAEQHIERIRQLISDNARHRKAFEQLMRGLRHNINPGLSEQDAIEMLSQHIITRPVFEALFENYEFAKNNPISKSMQRMLDLLDDEAKTEEEHEKLQKFYDYVRTTVGKIEDAAGRQRIIVELYDKFFKTASPKTVEKLGIVYTPVEVVDFIIRSVGYIIQKEFGHTLSDENVHILDPFTGTGTFITRLLQSGLIDRDALERKYRSEIHANEIVLMAYYIASINIENVYHELMGADAEYRSFDGICLTDTFQLGEEASEENLYSEQFPINSKRVIEQKKKRITVIVGNPPYSAGQRDAHDDAKNQIYPYLESRIADTYAQTKAMKRSVYNSYIKAFRWASDRINDNDGGVIGFVTDGDWLSGKAQDEMRKCFEKEFSSIYVFNLRGNQRTSGELSRKEGGKIFGSGSRTPIAITILVKRPKEANQKARIFYRDIGNYLSREEKLKIISNLSDISNPMMRWEIINPNEFGDWIECRNDLFDSYYLLGDKRDKKAKTVFSKFSAGVITNRETWAYNSSQYKLSANVERLIDFYNRQVKIYKEAISKDHSPKIQQVVSMDERMIKWDEGLLGYASKGVLLKYKDADVRVGLYRPFFKQYLYFNEHLNWSRYLLPKLLPTKHHSNLVICIVGNGTPKNFSVLMTNVTPDRQLMANGQCFPLYWYDDSTTDIADLFSAPQSEMDRYTRREGITDWILSTARKQYGSKVSKKDIFYYVYGILHSPEYRTAFASDLKKSLPRLPLVDSVDDFWEFSKAGRALAELHLNYETVEPYKGCLLVYGANTNRGDGMNYRVEKMRFGKLDSKTPDKTKIHYNQHITVEGIPLEAYDYVVNGKSAIEWIMERYAVTVHKDSGIRNDPNDWAAEHNDEKYILNLLLRIITVSLETMKIVYTLPKLKFEE
jgi:helicase domain protein